MDRGLTVERILSLENTEVGCMAECMCRAMLAATLTDDQARAIETTNHAPLGEAGVIELLKPDAERYQLQVDILQTIMHDKRLPSRNPKERGGQVGAEKSLDALCAFHEKLKSKSGTSALSHTERNQLGFMEDVLR